jgi:hypothetical protein
MLAAGARSHGAAPATTLRVAEQGAIYSTTIASALASSLRRRLRRLANRLDKFLRRAEAGGQ